MSRANRMEYVRLAEKWSKDVAIIYKGSIPESGILIECGLQA